MIAPYPNRRRGPMAARYAILLALLLGTAATLPAQTPAPNRTAGGGNMTREELREELQAQEAAAENSSYSRELRRLARLEASMIRQRLEEGDFQVGDRVAVVVPGYTELTDTFTVATGRVLLMPEVGEVSVAGVLRSEIRDHLQTELSKYLRDPVVRTEPLIRLAIVGAVGNPGFYNVSSTALLSDAIMRAGGPAGEAELERLRIERRGEELWDEEVVQDALVSGRTLDQLNLQAGDQIELPTDQDSFWSQVRIWLPVATGLIWLGTRIF